MTLRKCKYCKKKVEQLQINIPQVCKAKECIQSYYDEYSEKVNAKARQNILKTKADQHKEKKESLKTHKDHLKDLQKVFNEFIRTRDKDQPCISCNTSDRSKQYDAGHFRSVGAFPELRFNEDNVHKQCRKCNGYWGGNLIEYRKGLLDRIGPDRLKLLEGPTGPNKLTIEEIKTKIKEYKLKIKEL